MIVLTYKGDRRRRRSQTTPLSAVMVILSSGVTATRSSVSSSASRFLLWSQLRRMRSRSVVRESRSARVSGIPSATRLPAPSLNPAVSSLLAAASSPLQSTANQRPAPRCLPRRRLPGPYTSSGSRHSSSTRKLQSDPDDVVEARRSDVTAPPELSKLWAARCEQTEASAEEERVRQGMKDDLITAKATRRSVRLEVRPKPMTLQQTRRILQEMGRYGEVVSYRSQRVGTACCCFPFPSESAVQA